MHKDGTVCDTSIPQLRMTFDYEKNAVCIIHSDSVYT